MKKMNFFIFILPFFFSLDLFSFEILYTAAIIDHQYELRKKEYLHSLKILNEMGINPYVVESCQSESFFDFCEASILYTRTNDSNLLNKGINEAVSLLSAIKHYQFDPNTILIKLTGRYFFTNSSFLEFIEIHPEIDGFVKKINKSIFMGCFALRAIYFQQFLEHLNFKKMELKKINIENELFRFLSKNKQIKIVFLDTLNVTANIFGTGQCELTYW